MHLVNNTDFYAKVLHRHDWKWFRHSWGPPPGRNGPPALVLPGQRPQLSLPVWSIGGAALGLRWPPEARPVQPREPPQCPPLSAETQGCGHVWIMHLSWKSHQQSGLNQLHQTQRARLHWTNISVCISDPECGREKLSTSLQKLKRWQSRDWTTKHPKAVPLSSEAEPFPLNPDGCGGLHGPGTHLNAPREDAGPAPALKKTRSGIESPMTFGAIFHTS